MDNLNRRNPIGRDRILPMTNSQLEQQHSGDTGLIRKRDWAPWRTGLILVVLFLLIKLPFLLYSPYTFDEEEIKPGAIGHILLSGSPLPLFEFVLGGYEGGALVVGIASMPFQAVFGHTLLAYKIMATCVTLGILLLGAAVARRIAGPLAGWLVGLLIIAAPPYLTQFQFILWGNYVESTFLTLLALWLLFRMNDPKGLWAAPVMGLICGLGVFIHYGFAVSVLAVVFVWYLSDHRLPLKGRFWLFVLGVVVGFSPWLIYNMGSGFTGMGRVSDGVSTIPLADRAVRFLATAKSLLLRDYAMAWHFRDLAGLSGKTLGYAYWIMIASGFVLLLALLIRTIGRAIVGLLPLKRFDLDLKRAVALFVPIYLLGYGVVFCSTDYGLLRAEWGSMDPETHAHVFISLYIFLVGLGLALGLLANKYRPLAWLAVAPISLGLLGSVTLLDFSRSNCEMLSQSYVIYEDAVYSEIGFSYGDAGDGWEPIAAKLTGQAERSFYYGVGVGLGTKNATELDYALNACRNLKPAKDQAESTSLCLFGVGAGFYQRYETDPKQKDWILSTLEGPERTLVLAGAADILLIEGFTDHPAIPEAREIFFDEEIEGKYSEPVVRYIRSRLSAHRVMSVKD